MSVIMLVLPEMKVSRSWLLTLKQFSSLDSTHALEEDPGWLTLKHL